MSRKSKYKIITVTCPICKKEFSFKENKKRKYCSIECKGKAQKGNGKYRVNLDLEEIKNLYINEKFSAEEIAKKLGSTKRVILRRINDMGIVRTKGEAKSNYLKNNPEKNPFVRENVKAKIRPTLSDPKNIAKRQIGIEKFHKNISKEKRRLWNENLSKAWATFSDEKKKQIILKQYETKNKNGTTYQSLFEREITEWLKNLNINKIITNDYSIINKELDIYLPDYNLAIEFDGIYWHTELQGKNKIYHLNKTQLCEDKGIQLIHIFEDEWILKKEIVKSIIKGKLGLHEKLYARKCELKEIDNKEAILFYKQNHIQGSINSKLNIGLYYQNELVSCLSFKKARYNKQYNWEITRFANKLEVSVIGGFAKMLKHFQSNYSGSIITYSDRRYFDGSIYKNNGFEELNVSKPNYFYTDYQFRYSRIKFQKHKLEKELEYFDSNLTEWENMQLNGWDRIWDCGNRVFLV